ncbi:MAG: hypothetical protein LAO78_00800 [Acidobacteriia bacterium]|nr:hypothetical protein [Terriglobia bacterium]
MNHFKLHELLLLSEKEQKARKITFHPQATVLTGSNETGKSSIIKSVFQTLGADPAKVSPEWKSAGVFSLLKVEVAGVILHFFRHLQAYAVFDENGALLYTFTSVSREVGPYLANLVNFHISLITKTNVKITPPPPAFFFLPFYIDQDKSWDSSWAGFANLGYIKDYKKNMAEYHTGIRPNRFYELSTKRAALKTTIAEIEARVKVIKGVLSRLRTQFSNSEFDVDTHAFEAEIDKLVHEAQALLKAENELKSQLSELGEYRNQLLNQRQVVQSALSELQADYELAVDSAAYVECPSCGQEYANSFVERFELAKDQDQLSEFLADMESEIAKTETKIAKAREQFKENAASAAIISDLLNTKKEEVTLRTVTLNVGRREAAAEFDKTIAEENEELAKYLLKQNEISKELKSLDDKARKKEIIGYYANHLQSFLTKLHVSNVGPEAYKAVTADLAKMGSAKPRALLAYFFAILHTAYKYSEAAFCPIVIDSPQQQEQDKNNLRAMLELMRDQRPNQSQLLLGIVDDLGVDFSGTRIELTEKFNVLRKADYQSVKAEIEPFQNKVLQASLKPLQV